jgi:hypothetical protein
MSMAAGNFASIADQVKLDVLPKDYATVNAATRKEIARTFICEAIKNSLSRLVTYFKFYSRYTYR